MSKEKKNAKKKSKKLIPVIIAGVVIVAFGLFENQGAAH